MYSTYLNHKVEEIQLDNEEFQKLDSQSSTISNKGRINSWLNINTLENPSHIGKVFCETGQFSDINLINGNAEEKDFLDGVQKLLEDSSDSETYYFKEVILEISPECDFAQNKRNFYRVIPGIFVSEALLQKAASDEKILKDKIRYEKTKKKGWQWNVSNNILISPQIEYKDVSVMKTFNAYLILDLSQFKTVPLKNEEQDYFEGKDYLFSDLI